MIREATPEERADLAHGLEWFETQDGEDCCCARCGSSVGRAGDDGSGGPLGALICLSSREWCEAHPLPGREEMRRAGGRDDINCGQCDPYRYDRVCPECGAADCDDPDCGTP